MAARRPKRSSVQPPNNGEAATAAIAEAATAAARQLRREQSARAAERAREVEDSPRELRDKCRLLARALRNAKHLVVYTGAGISTAADIPDYRGPRGVWTRLQRGETVGRVEVSAARPTFTHMALSALWARGTLKFVVSQNCDGLHIRSGLPRRALAELHGDMFVELCYACKQLYLRAFDTTERTARHAHGTRRLCHGCGAELRDSIVHFGERGRAAWPLNWRGALRHAARADVVLCLGSSLKVLRRYPRLWSMRRPKHRRPSLYIVNLQWTPKDSAAKLKINARCDDVMRQVCRRLRIRVPHYRPSSDPLLYHATPLSPRERHTSSRPSLAPPRLLSLSPSPSPLSSPSPSDSDEELPLRRLADRIKGEPDMEMGTFTDRLKGELEMGILADRLKGEPEMGILANRLKGESEMERLADRLKGESEMERLADRLKGESEMGILADRLKRKPELGSLANRMKREPEIGILTDRLKGEPEMERLAERLKREPELRRLGYKIKGEPEMGRLADKMNGEPEMEGLADRFKGEPEVKEEMKEEVDDVFRAFQVSLCYGEATILLRPEHAPPSPTPTPASTLSALRRFRIVRNGHHPPSRPTSDDDNKLEPEELGARLRHLLQCGTRLCADVWRAGEGAGEGEESEEERRAADALAAACTQRALQRCRAHLYPGLHTILPPPPPPARPQCAWCHRHRASSRCLWYGPPRDPPRASRRAPCACCTGGSAAPGGDAAGGGWYGKGYRKGRRKRR